MAESILLIFSYFMILLLIVSFMFKKKADNAPMWQHRMKKVTIVGAMGLGLFISCYPSFFLVPK